VRHLRKVEVYIAYDAQQVKGFPGVPRTMVWHAYLQRRERKTEFYKGAAQAVSAAVAAQFWNFWTTIFVNSWNPKFRQNRFNRSKVITPKGIYGQTDRETDGRTDRQTHILTPIYGCAKNFFPIKISTSLLTTWACFARSLRSQGIIKKFITCLKRNS